MTMPPTGDSVKVTGKRRASAASGPTPGSTPTSVPIRLPRKHR